MTGLPARLMQADIVNALRKADRQRASIMLSNLQQTKEALTSQDLSNILEYCAEAPHPLFAMEILEIIEKAIDTGKSNYRSLPRALTKGGYSREVTVLQRNLSAVHDLWKDCTKFYSPSIITLRKFVKAFSTLGDLESAYHILQRMVVLAGEGTDHLRVSSKRRCQSERLDIPVPALNGVEDLKLVSDYDLPSSFQGKM